MNHILESKEKLQISDCMASVRYWKFSGGNSNNKAKACGPRRHVYLPLPTIDQKR
jgi:hypothetical protein